MQVCSCIQDWSNTFSALNPARPILQSLNLQPNNRAGLWPCNLMYLPVLSLCVFKVDHAKCNFPFEAAARLVAAKAPQHLSNFFRLLYNHASFPSQIPTTYLNTSLQSFDSLSLSFSHHISLNQLATLVHILLHPRLDNIGPKKKATTNQHPGSDLKNLGAWDMSIEGCEKFNRLDNLD